MAEMKVEDVNSESSDENESYSNNDVITFLRTIGQQMYEMG